MLFHLTRLHLGRPTLMPKLLGCRNYKNTLKLHLQNEVIKILKFFFSKLFFTWSRTINCQVSFYLLLLKRESTNNFYSQKFWTKILKRIVFFAVLLVVFWIYFLWRNSWLPLWEWALGHTVVQTLSRATRVSLGKQAALICSTWSTVSIFAAFLSSHRCFQ